MSVIWVPYHLDEHLPGLDLLFHPDEVISPELQPVPEDRIVLAGARELDPPKVSYLAGAQIRRAEVTAASAAALAGPPDVPWYVHVDLDVLDPAEVPGVRYPAPGGPSAGQLAAALGALIATGRVAAIGIACSWYPGHAAAARLAPHLETVLA